MKEENKFKVGDAIVLKEGNVEGHYIVIACAIEDYVLVNKNGNQSTRVLSKMYVDQHSKYTSEQQAKEFVDMCSKAGISAEELSRPSKEDNTVGENDYNKKLVYEHRELTTLLNSLYKVKNKKYGDSFGQGVREFGYISALTRMSDKYNRLKQLIMSNQTGSDTDESLEDTLVDLANYCLMTVMELNHAKENCTHGNNS